VTRGRRPFSGPKVLNVRLFVSLLPPHQFERDFNHGKSYNYSRRQGYSPKPPSQFFPTEIRPDRLKLAVSTLTPLFVDDPILTYLLFTLSDSKRKTYLQAFMTSLLKAAALNGATFLEANNWDSCAVLVHPGRRVDNPYTLLQAGLIPAMCNIGISGIKVRALWFPSHLYSKLTNAANPVRIHIQNRCGKVTHS